MARSIWGIVGSLVALAACASSDEMNNTNAGDNYAGEVATPDDGGAQTDGATEQPVETPTEAETQSVSLATGCPAYHSDVYTPFGTMSSVSSGSVSQYPWRGHGTSYPDTVEDFRAYGPSLPTTVECGANKGVRDYLDVTAGCLSAASVDGGKVGEIHGTSDGYYRSFALPYDSAQQKQVAWTDQGVEYRFKYSKWTGNVSNPGFKAFARYLTEYDLYVGSWRMDGVVQIQKKHCGEYTILKRIANYGPPAPNVWHTIRFEVVGSEQRLYLDGKLALTTTDDTIKRGTAGIRIDSAEGSYIDDWRVYAP
jgi:hypothetical protein